MKHGSSTDLFPELTWPWTIPLKDAHMSILSHRYKYHLVCQGFFKFNPKTNFLKSQALLTWNLKLQAILEDLKRCKLTIIK